MGSLVAASRTNAFHGSKTSQKKEVLFILLCHVRSQIKIFAEISWLLSMIGLLLLSRSSHVRLCVTPLTAAHQAPLSLGFSRQEHWSGLPFPSPMHESEVAWSCPTLSDPMNCSLPGSFLHGIFQARVLEWVASAFSTDRAKARKDHVCVVSHLVMSDSL